MLSYFLCPQIKSKGLDGQNSTKIRFTSENVIKNIYIGRSMILPVKYEHKTARMSNMLVGCLFLFWKTNVLIGVYN